MNSTNKSDSYHWEIPDYSSQIYKPKSNHYCVLVFVINEGDKIVAQLNRMQRLAELVDIVVADGGSTDGSLEDSFLSSVQVRAKLTKIGPGKLSSQMRMGFAWALAQGYRGVIVMDGNDKDDPQAIENFKMLLEQGFDHIQGSRFITGGRAVNTPMSRLLGLKLIHAPLISIASRTRQTDTTNGFRAYSSRLLTDYHVRVFRNTFQTYELHYHLAIEAGRSEQFRTIETPVIRIYPATGKTPTKITPISGNLLILRILFSAISGKYRFRGGTNVE